MKSVRQNSLQAWVLAARPKTLSGALVSVLTATALAYTLAPSLHREAPMLAALCAVFASLMQVASNFINDLIDFRKGRDGADRLGPERACQQGWISPRAMAWGVAIVLILSAVVGLSILGVLLYISSFPAVMLIAYLVLLGAVCMIAAFLYTTYFSSRGMGDVMVLLFFGLVPVCGTYFALTDHLTMESLLLGLSIGFVVDTLLCVNNYRDRDTDRAVGKHTLIVLLGEAGGKWLYFLVGFFGVVSMAALDFSFQNEFGPITLCSLLYLPLHLRTWRQMVRIHKGRALNEILGKTSRNILLFALLVVVGFVVTARSCFAGGWPSF